MKKQDRHRDRWLLRQRAKKLRRRLKRRFASRCLQRRSGPKSDKVNSEQKGSAIKRHEIILPEKLDLTENFDLTVSHLANVRLASQRGFRGFRLRYLNFDRISFISPAAALLLASEIDRWNESVGGRLRAKADGWNAEVRQLLCEMGFFELLNIQRPDGVKDTISTTFLPFLRGNVEDRTNGGALAKKLRQQIDEVAGVEIKKHLLFDGLTEAITNVSQHAYSKTSRRKRRYRPWWMSAAFAKDTNTVTVCFFDHGRTIPGTLPLSGKIERWKHRIGVWDDGQLIRAAMTIGRSSTGKAGRGRGLKNFLEIIHGYADSQLTIFSRKGVLRVRNAGNGHLKFSSSVVETSLRGTLIEWQFVPIAVN